MHGLGIRSDMPRELAIALKSYGYKLPLIPIEGGAIHDDEISMVATEDLSKGMEFSIQKKVDCTITIYHETPVHNYNIGVISIDGGNQIEIYISNKTVIDVDFTNTLMSKVPWEVVEALKQNNFNIDPIVPIKEKQ